MTTQLTRKVNAHSNLGTLQQGDVVLGERTSGTTGLFTVPNLAGGGVSDGDYGDITVSGSNTIWTIDNGTVTLAKMANMATASVIYRTTAGTGVPEVNSLATLKTDLGLTGTNSGDQTITLTGDVTGSGTGSFVATIANDAVTYAKIQNVSATDKLLGRSSALAGDVEEITCTAAGRALIDDATAADQRTTLGLGTLATQSGTFVDWTNATSNIYTTGKISAGTENETTVIIGATTYNAQISAHVESATDFDYVAHRHSNTASAAATYLMARSRGTGTVESVVVTGDRIGEIAAIGHDGTDYAFGARIQFDSTGTIGADSIPTNITFKVAPDGGGAPATAMTINANKNVDFTNGVDVTGSVTATTSVSIGGNATAAGYIDLLEDSDNGANKITITAPASVASDKTITLPDTTGTVALTANKLSAFAATTSAELAGVISDETGSGALVFATSPTLVTPALGTPASGVLTNCTGLLGTGISTGSYINIQRGTSDQSITNGVQTKIQLNNELTDTDGTFDSTTNYRHTPTKAGKWLYVFGVWMDLSLAGAQVEVDIFKNGTLAAGAAVAGGSAVADSFLPGVTVLDMNGSTDYVEVYVYHDDTAARNCKVGAYTCLRGILLSTN